MAHRGLPMLIALIFLLLSGCGGSSGVPTIADPPMEAKPPAGLGPPVGVERPGPDTPQIFGVAVQRLPEVAPNLGTHLLVPQVEGDVTSWQWVVPDFLILDDVGKSQPILTTPRTGQWFGEVVACRGENCTEPFRFPIMSHDTPGQRIEPALPVIVRRQPAVLQIAVDAHDMRLTFPSGTSVLEQSLGSVTIVCENPGLFTASIAKCPKVLAGNCIEYFYFQYEVIEPPLGVMISDSPTVAGVELDELVLEASATRPIASWQWDFGGRTFPSTSQQERPQVTLTRPGGGIGSLTTVDLDGISEVVVFQISCSNRTGVNWKQPRLLTKPHQEQARPFVYADRLVFPFREVGEIAASDALQVLFTGPGDWNSGSWVTHEIVHGLPHSNFPILGWEHRSRLIIATQIAGELTLYIAETTAPDLPTNWTSLKLQIGSQASGIRAWGGEGGSVVVWFDGSKLMMASSVAPIPESSTDWEIVAVPGGSQIQPTTAIIEHAGGLALAGAGSDAGLWIAQTTELPGHPSFSWQFSPGPQPSISNIFSRLGLQGQRLILAGSSIQRSLVARPQGATDWEQLSSTAPTRLFILGGELYGISSRGHSSTFGSSSAQATLLHAIAEYPVEGTAWIERGLYTTGYSDCGNGCAAGTQTFRAMGLSSSTARFAFVTTLESSGYFTEYQSRLIPIPINW